MAGTMHDGHGVDAEGTSTTQDSLHHAAELMRDAVHGLGADNSVLFLVDEREITLTPALVVGGPLSLFTTPDHISTSDERYIAAIAFRTKQQVVRDFPGAEPRDVSMPFPYLVAATPIIRGDLAAGILTFVWALPKDKTVITAEDTERCTAVAAELADDRGLFAALQGCSNPRFVLAGGDDVNGAAGTSLLFQTRTLESALSAATGLRDVVAAVMDRIARPTGAEKMAHLSFEGGRVRVIGHSGFPQSMSRPVLEAGETSLDVPCSGRGRFYETEESVQAAGLGADFASGLQSAVVLPLVSGERTIGALLLGFTHPRVFSPEERAWLVTMAGMVSATWERAHLYDISHTTAQELQRRLLPRHVAELAELDTTARYFSASGNRTGGDWFDVLKLPDDKVGLLIGDAEGHNVASAALMGQVRTALQAYAAEGHDPAEVLTRTNTLLWQLGAERFVSCCCVWVDRFQGTAEIACAGHPGPLIRMAQNEVFSLPEDLIGPPLVVAEDTVYQATQVTLRAGDALALFTDGLVHSHSPDYSVGLAAISGMLTASAGHPEDIADRICAPAAGARYREDDAALLLAVYTGTQRAVGHRVVHLRVKRHDLEALGTVRRLVRRQLDDWGWALVSDEAELLTTELVTNALIHADSEVDLWLREHPDRIRVDVCDWDPRPPVPAPITFTEEFDCEAEHGRGLLIVEALASSWGKASRGRGKSVWFELGRS
ncbi:SpoIIE family protein phosphatase [Streptomyces sp. NPDC102274]|uniref:ATP-binding SpoIIE family protein phosphatase n=1 Tax=Streptomyces sp. NPDC102274 TaxID=3366151 RepID=UPI0038227BF4